MIFVLVVEIHSVALEHFVLVDMLNCFWRKHLKIRRVACLAEFHALTILVCENKQMRSLLYDVIFHSVASNNYKRVALYAEISRRTRGIREIHRISLHTEENVVLVLVEPYSSLQSSPHVVFPVGCFWSRKQ